MSAARCCCGSSVDCGNMWQLDCMLIHYLLILHTCVALQMVAVADQHLAPDSTVLEAWLFLQMVPLYTSQVCVQHCVALGLQALLWLH